MALTGEQQYRYVNVGTPWCQSILYRLMAFLNTICAIERTKGSFFDGKSLWMQSAKHIQNPAY